MIHWMIYVYIYIYIYIYILKILSTCGPPVAFSRIQVFTRQERSVQEATSLGVTGETPGQVFFDNFIGFVGRGVFAFSQWAIHYLGNL